MAIHVPMFWSHNSPWGVHKSGVSGGSSSQNAERAFGSLSRRLVSSKSIEEYANSKQKESVQSTCGSRFYDKSKEIRTATKSVSGLHRGSFLLDKVLVCPTQERVVKIREVCMLVKQFPTAQNYLYLLGLMASCIELVPNARLFMRPIQLHLLHFSAAAEVTKSDMYPYRKGNK